MKIGVIKEGKVPPDSRVTLIPAHCKALIEKYPIDIIVSPSEGRCYSNQEYIDMGIEMSTDMSECDVLMGVKEVPIQQLIPNKTYFFFSHTIKKQVYNRELLKACVERRIKLLDYETLTDEKGKRLIAFGKFAGMVGAHNALMTYAWRTHAFDLPRMNSLHDYEAAKEVYSKTHFPPLKIVLTGTGRVGMGAAKVLLDMGIKKVSPKDYIENTYDEAVFTQLKCRDYAAAKDGSDFNKKEFYTNPSAFKSAFEPFSGVSDIMINGIYWDNAAPAFFTQEQMAQEDFKIKVIADVTCDIAPISSIPSTLFASTIADPIFGYDPKTGSKTAPHQEGVIDMMTIDNLPNELPRDASKSFGEQFMANIIEELLQEDSEVIKRATVTEKGDLGEHFEYLRDYLNG